MLTIVEAKINGEEIETSSRAAKASTPWRLGPEWRRPRSAPTTAR
jgi:hypothetical protein